MRKNATHARPEAQAPSHDFHPRNPLGCSYALIPERLTVLPGGELLALAWLLAARRSTACLRYTVQQLGAATGFCSKTLAAHVASLRAKGLVDPDVLRAAPEALTKPGERHAKVFVRDLMKQPTAAPFRLYVVARFYTDRNGRCRVSRKHLAERLNRSTRTVRSLFATLRAFGIPTPARLYRSVEKTFRSTRKKLSGRWKKPSAYQERGSVRGSHRGHCGDGGRGRRTGRPGRLRQADVERIPQGPDASRPALRSCGRDGTPVAGAVLHCRRRSSTFEVFAPDGTWLGSVELPPGLERGFIQYQAPYMEIGTDYVLGVWRDELDVQYVRMYRLNR